MADLLAEALRGKPAETGLDAEINEERYRDVDIEVPAEGELFVPLPKVATGDIDDDDEQDESEDHHKGMHCPPLAAWYVMRSPFVNELDSLRQLRWRV